jgi:hypothetical protein
MRVSEVTMKGGRPTVRLAGGRRVKMDDELFGLLLAVGAFDEEPSGERRRPKDQPPQPGDSGVILRVMLAVVAALFLVAFLRSMIR